MMVGRSYKAAIFILVLVGMLLASFAAQAQESVRVRAANLTGFTRLVFDFTEPVSYEVTSAQGRASVIFNKIFDPDFSEVALDEFVLLDRLEVDRLGEQTVVTIVTRHYVDIRPSKRGRFVIFDLYAGSDNFTQTRADIEQGGEGAERLAPRESQLSRTSEDLAAGGDADVTVTGSLEAAEQEDETTTQEPSGAAKNARAEGQAARDGIAGAADRLDVTRALVNSQREVLDFVIEGEAANSHESFVVAPEIEELPAGLRINFDFPIDVSSAVFSRGGQLWVIFDREGGFDSRNLKNNRELVAERIKALHFDIHSKAMVFRFLMRGDQNVTVEKENKVWRISLKDTPTKPRFPLRPQRRLAADSGQQIFIAAPDVGRKLIVEDPFIGDEIVVVPLGRQGQGFSDTYNYSSAEILETAQGMAIVPLSDSVEVARFASGVAVSDGATASQAAEDEIDSTQLSEDLRLINFAAWRRGTPEEYREIKTRIFYELSVSPEASRNRARWDLARFFLGHRRAAETLGMLDIMLMQEPELLEQGDFRAVRGIANYKMGRLEEAWEDLSLPALDAEQDAELWKMLIEEERGHYKKALRHYELGKDIIGTYDPHERATFVLSVIRSALAVENVELARHELDLLETAELTALQSEELRLLSARLEELDGDETLALARYDDLAFSRNYYVGARSRLYAVLVRLRNDEISRPAAIELLERLRYAWRGPEFELEVLARLAKLYFAEEKYEQGLDLLKLAASAYPEQAREAHLARQMQQVFRQLFAGEYAAQLPPIKAIALFQKFQEFTPPGADGDAIIRRLSERLASVELLDEAAEILEYQIGERLEGVPRAQIAINLAKIYILDKESEKALAILRATREPALPDDVFEARRLVEARALVELARYEEAEVLLSQDDSVEADQLRIDLYWKSKDYGRMVPVVEKVLAGGVLENGVLNDRQRFNLMRLTLAHTFLQDRQALMSLRDSYLPKMYGGDFATSFELLTSEQELTGSELGVIAGQIASVEKLQSFMRDYREDFDSD